jgi:3-deoxy-D-manno-octulosonic-acid transferase
MNLYSKFVNEGMSSLASATFVLNKLTPQVAKDFNHFVMSDLNLVHVGPFSTPMYKWKGSEQQAEKLGLFTEDELWTRFLNTYKPKIK